MNKVSRNKENDRKRNSKIQKEELIEKEETNYTEKRKKCH